MKRCLLLLLPLAAFAAAPSTNWNPNVTGLVAWNKNISNGEADWDRISAIQLNADLLSSSEYAITTHDTAHLTFHLGGDWYPRFWQLARGLGGARLDWRHTFGDDEFAPVFTVEGAGDYVAATESARRGTLTAATLTLAKKFVHGWRVGLSERFEQYAAKNAVFDSSSSETTLEVGRDINDSTRLTVSARWRQGDVVTYAQYTRPDLIAIARARADFDTFRTPMTAYAADARTVGGRVALVHATTVDTALMLSYDYSRTDRTGLRFGNQVVALSIVRQF